MSTSQYNFLYYHYITIHSKNQELLFDFAYYYNKKKFFSGNVVFLTMNMHKISVYANKYANRVVAKYVDKKRRGC